MQRSSQDLYAVIQHATEGCQRAHWLPALYILMAVLPDFFRADDRPHALLRYIYFTAPGSIGLDFRGVLEEYPFSRGQRLAVLVAWQLFNGGDRDGPRADFDVVCAVLDASNFEAVMDGMRLHAGRDPGDRIGSRIEESLHDIYKEWEQAGL